MKSVSLSRMTLAAVAITTLAACNTGAPLNRTPVANNPALRQLNTPTANAAVAGKLVIKYRAGLSSAQSISAFGQLGIQHVRPLGNAQSALEVVQVPAGQNVAAAARALEQDPAIEYVEEVFAIPFPEVQRASDDSKDATPAAYPNDPMFSRQYSHKVSQSQAGWANTRGDRNTLIAIVDSGVDVTHPDLRAKIVDTFNAADNVKEVVDVIGHGTHVAGIAAAMTNNGTGVAGVAPDCGILAIKVSSGTSSSPSTDGIANGIIWAADHNADVINLSLGSSRQSKVITDAVNYALSKNVVVLAATGNDSGRIQSFPAAIPGVIAVGSTDATDRRSSFSNYGPWISVVAPGSAILSSFPLNDNLIGQKEYGMISGTSMATPFATGVAALVRSKYKKMPVAMVKQVLESSADDKGAPGFDEEYGHGRLNVARALSRAAEMDTQLHARR